MNVYAIRHGESESNRSRCYSGWSQVHLTDRGREDAARAGRLLADVPISRVYASDLPRALETAEIALPGRSAIRREALRENHVGSFQDQSVAQCDARYGALSLQARQQRDYTPVGGENRSMMLARVAAFMRKLENLPLEENIAVFCHEGTIQCMLSHVLGFPVPPHAARLSNGSVSVFVYDGAWRLQRWNL